jgi:2-keto-3-deoxy-6-phosphogluconate aldolase
MGGAGSYRGCQALTQAAVEGVCVGAGTVLTVEQAEAAAKVTLK